MPPERRRGLVEVERELAEMTVELRWTRRFVAALLALQGGNLAAHALPWFSG